MLDLDHFKRMNDAFGHAAGDFALRLVGQFLQSAIRAEDIACRFGGEEFVIILPKATVEDTPTAGRGAAARHSDTPRGSERADVPDDDDVDGRRRLSGSRRDRRGACSGPPTKRSIAPRRAAEIALWLRGHASVAR